MDELPVADVRTKFVESIRSIVVTATIDEEFGDVTNCSCGCEAFYNYEGMCKHCVAMLLNYVNKRTPMEILRLKRGQGTETRRRGTSGGKDGDSSAVEKSTEWYSIVQHQIYVTEAIYGRSRSWGDLTLRWITAMQD